MSLRSSTARSAAPHLLPAALLVPVPSAPRRVAAALAVAVVLFLAFVGLAPYRQNVSGEGTVIAFAPDDRPQAIEATLSGRIARWHVVEGQAVEEGAILVELVDNDPERLDRLVIERDAYRARLEAYEDQVQAHAERLLALDRARTAQIAAAEAEVRIAREKLQGERDLLSAAEASAATAALQQRRMGGLAEEGLASQRDRELAELGAASADASLRAARAKVRAAEGELETKRASLERARASTDADLRSARASLRSAETQVASARASLAGVETRLAQQEAQRIRAPRAGIVQRVLVQQGGVQVSRGQTLAILVPSSASRAVELEVDGNDAAIVTPGRDVRLQFEGWPAVQFAGWPSVAVGTFGGRVAFVDPSGDGRGNFRVVVLPDPTDAPWPDVRFLRQGTRVKGWVILDEVSVAFELWRQLNGFPPRYPEAPRLGSPDRGRPDGASAPKDEASDASSDDAYGGGG